MFLHIRNFGFIATAKVGCKRIPKFMALQNLLFICLSLQRASAYLHLQPAIPHPVSERRRQHLVQKEQRLDVAGELFLGGKTVYTHEGTEICHSPTVHVKK